ncbi:hypothetical protein H257_16635 [Aphanomyces astaci]|uniref:Uncharacterized protein n=1 Tax=Aphanomyces astaci TaxID=112090 RepID=W4FK50_APHAT|nr:hypothetical protein H257_16635 [Aphanomyces astaci]ETV67083.1 hypothetical protein H257_16635 [Aphanomyces astaci]|eukprot:XP_009843452.1 hypothetical protein H257_16635 [Aphanomyces astaci]
MLPAGLVREYGWNLLEKRSCICNDDVMKVALYFICSLLRRHVRQVCTVVENVEVCGGRTSLSSPSTLVRWCGHVMHEDHPRLASCARRHAMRSSQMPLHCNQHCKLLSKPMVYLLYVRPSLVGH